MSDLKAAGMDFAGMLRWIVPVAVVTAGIGLYPTWIVGGRSGVHALLAAKAMVLCVKIAAMALVVYIARRGPRAAAYGFVLSGLAAGGLCLAGTALLWAVTDLPAVILAVWVSLIFLVIMIAESLKLARWLLLNPPRRSQRNAME